MSVWPKELNCENSGSRLTRWTLILGAVGLSFAFFATPAIAQTFSLDFGPTDSTGPDSTTGRVIQLLLLMTVLTVAPAILLMVTCFTRIIIVLSLIRRALGTNTSPPNMVMMSLAIFMTIFIMAPTFEAAWDAGLNPLIEGQIDEGEAFERTSAPFRNFMLNHVRPKDLALFLDMSNAGPIATPEETPLQALVPAFLISEIRRGFEIGFLIYVPFIIIDMVIASVLMSMGMMMLPPMMLSLPFKLIFFVLVDGWYLLVGSLVQSFQGGG